MIIIAGVDMTPALTAVSPSTSAPTTESASPTYFGIRIEASFKTSSTKSVKNISVLGESARPATELEILRSSWKGIIWILKSWAEMYSAGSISPIMIEKMRSMRSVVAR